MNPLSDGSPAALGLLPGASTVTPASREVTRTRSVGSPAARPNGPHMDARAGKGAWGAAHQPSSQPNPGPGWVGFIDEVAELHVWRLGAGKCARICYTAPRWALNDKTRLLEVIRGWYV